MREGTLEPGQAAVNAALGPRLQVPTEQIPRLHYPDELTPERFEREFVARSRPCIITGLIDDWPAHMDSERTWRGDRWDRLVAETQIEAGFDPSDNRMMHFGDDEGVPGILFNPGRLRIAVWAFYEVGRLRQFILEERRRNGGRQLCLCDHPGLKERLGQELTVQNMPFLPVDDRSQLRFFKPLSCRIRDLLPLAFYLSCDTYALPKAMQEDLCPQAQKLMPSWGQPDSSRIWATTGGPWTTPYPPWRDDAIPEPSEDPAIYSCFHFDRMENFHSVIAGQKEVVLVSPEQPDVLNATRFSTQNQWLVAPIVAHGSTGAYLGSTLLSSRSRSECTSDQSAVHPLRSADVNRKVSKNAWPDKVDFPVCIGRLGKGETLYIPAYHWHFVATSTPPALSLSDDGPLAMSVNFWWWPIHNDDKMERWSFRNEVASWENRRVEVPNGRAPVRESHAMSFYHLTAKKRAEAAQYKAWPCPPPLAGFEVVD